MNNEGGNNENFLSQPRFCSLSICSLWTNNKSQSNVNSLVLDSRSSRQSFTLRFSNSFPLIWNIHRVIAVRDYLYNLRKICMERFSQKRIFSAQFISSQVEHTVKWTKWTINNKTNSAKNRIVFCVELKSYFRRAQSAPARASDWLSSSAQARVSAFIIFSSGYFPNWKVSRE